MKTTLAVVILTFNESIHIARAVNNVIGWADQVLVLDSFSTDDTVDLAKALGAEVLLRKFDNYKKQREYAIEYYKDKAEWVFFLDADEYLLEELKLEINEAINNTDVQGYYMARRLMFMGKWIKWGGYYPTYLLRLFRPEKASVLRDINEHIFVEGNTRKLKHDFIHDDLKDIGHWIDKHNRYAAYEAEVFLNIQKKSSRLNNYDWTLQSERKRWMREKVWNTLPILIRPFIYFIYRYFIRLGILDGKQGFIYHFLQGLWCQFLIDVKYFELKKTPPNKE